MILVFFLGFGTNLLLLGEINDNSDQLQKAGDNMYYALKLSALTRAKYMDAEDLSRSRPRGLENFREHEQEFQEILSSLKGNVDDHKKANMLIRSLEAENQKLNQVFEEQIVPMYKFKQGQDVEGLSEESADFSAPMFYASEAADDLVYAANTLSQVFTEEEKSSMVNLTNNINSTYTSSIVALIITLLVASLIITLLERNLVNTLQKLVDYSNQLASGNLNVDKLKINTNDQIEELARSFNTMVDNLSNLITSISNTSNEVTAFSQELSSLASEADSTIQSASSTVENMSSGVDQVAASSQ